MIPWEDSKRPPRRWQAEVLPIILASINARENAIFEAIMGSGKSVVIAETARIALAKAMLNDADVVVVTTPTQDLVEQLSATVAERCGEHAVGQFFGKQKQADRRVIITCNPSAGKLHEALQKLGRKVSLMICDEVHRTEGPEIRAAITALDPTARIGLTATAYRANVKERLTLWDTAPYHYRLGDAWDDEVLVRYNPITYDGTTGIKQHNEWCLKQMLLQKGPGVVSSISIQDCEEYASWLTARGFPAEPVHSKRKSKDNKETLRKLVAGEIRCAVHVAMLSEGVDIPQLRWICLRRPVGSRVRFVQEVGRPLRILNEPDQWGPKDTVDIIDPHGLFEEHGISHPEALGAAPPKPINDGLNREFDELPPLPGLTQEMPPMKRIGIASAWARRLLLVMQAYGMAQQTHASFIDGQWRTRKASAKQIDALRRMQWAAKFMPKSHRDSLKWAINARGVLKKGACSDLLSVLRALADVSKDQRAIHRYWKWPKNVSIPPLEIDGL